MSPARLVTMRTILDNGKRLTWPLNAGSRELARDVANVYEETEAKTCHGCCNEISVAVAYGWIKRCALGCRYGTRCNKYLERAPREHGRSDR